MTDPIIIPERVIAEINRRLTPEYALAVAVAAAEGKCFLQSYLGEPWHGWCLTHNVADSMDHHFSVHPDANND